MHFYHIQFSKLLNIFTDKHFYSLYSYFMSRWFTIIEQKPLPHDCDSRCCRFCGERTLSKNQETKDQQQYTIDKEIFNFSNIF